MKNKALIFLTLIFLNGCAIAEPNEQLLFDLFIRSHSQIADINELDRVIKKIDSGTLNNKLAIKLIIFEKYLNSSNSDYILKNYQSIFVKNAEMKIVLHNYDNIPKLPFEEDLKPYLLYKIAKIKKQNGVSFVDEIDEITKKYPKAVGGYKNSDFDWNYKDLILRLLNNEN